METREIIKAIQKLPVDKRILIIERTLQSIRVNDSKKQLESAAEFLYDDYKENEELIAFTALDQEAFYETR